jgi:hypothetical protein
MSLKRRLENLEEHHRVQFAPAKWEAWDELVKRLTTEELKWLCEPCDKAQSLVPCPHVEMVSCGCRSDERRRRGFEAHPDLVDEFVRRRDALVGRAGEIRGREVWRHTRQ